MIQLQRTALLLPIPIRASLVGVVSKGAVDTTVTLPAGSRKDDLVVIADYQFNALGGSGTAFLHVDVGSARLNYRQLEPNDLTTPITLSSASPCGVWVFRGPRKLSTIRSSVSWTSPTDETIPGFTKAANCLGVLAVQSLDGNAIPYFGAGSDPDQAQPMFAVQSGFGSGAYFARIAATVDLSSLDNGEAVIARSTTSVLNHDAALIELLY